MTLTEAKLLFMAVKHFTKDDREQDYAKCNFIIQKAILSKQSYCNFENLSQNVINELIERKFTVHTVNNVSSVSGWN